MIISVSLVDRAATFGAASGRTRLVPSNSQRPDRPKLTVTVLAAALFSGIKLLPVHHGRKVRLARNAQDIGSRAHLARKLANPKSSKKTEITVSVLKARKLSSSMEDVKKIMRGDIQAENFAGLSTGFGGDMDKLYRPVRGEFTVVTAPPGSGKSEWLLSLLVNMAQVHGWRFATCMFEHKLEDFLQALMEKVFVTHRSKIRYMEDYQINGFWDDFLPRHVCKIGAMFSEELSIDQILRAAIHYADEHKDDGGLHGLIIDPYNYISKDVNELGQRGGETQFVASILRKVKQFAADYNCHVWIVVHPTKNSATAKGEEPTLYDCTGSANWYNMCDNGIVLQRNKDPNAGSMAMVKLNVAKVRNRFAGEVGRMALYFDRETRCYSTTAP